MNISLVHDIAIILLAAGVAGMFCKRVGLSVIVGYLLAGILVGPSTPLKLIDDQERIEAMAQVGLVFVMFAVGLNLSLTKLSKMGAGTLLATLLGAGFVFALTALFGHAAGWEFSQCLFVAAMLMVSSSAVISKIIEELRLSRDKTAQAALTITVSEDIVAVVMLTILSTVGVAAGGATAVATASAADGGVAESVGAVVEAAGSIGWVFQKIGAFIILVLALCIFFVPRWVRKLDTSGDPELRTVGVAGVLLILAFAAASAGFSTALGAFLFGSIVAELPQKGYIEKSFDGLRSMFSSIFFVSIGMMADPVQLLDATTLMLTLGLVLFAMFGRSFACSMALIATGMAPREARRAGLLLTPLGEFTFIIAQMAVSAKVFPEYLYPVSIALSVLTVMLTPFVNRHANAITAFIERIEPPFVTKALAGYHDFLLRLRQNTGGKQQPRSGVWEKMKPLFAGAVTEMLFISGIFLFQGQLLDTLLGALDEIAKDGRHILFGADLGPALVWLSTGGWLKVAYIVVVDGVALFFLVALIRRAIAVVNLLAQHFAGPGLQRGFLRTAFGGMVAAVLIFWLYSVLPQVLRNLAFGNAIAGGLRLALLAIVAVVLVLVSRKLIAWHKSWQATVGAVLSGANEGEEARAELLAEARKLARRGLLGQLESWDMHLQDCAIPENAACVGQPLRQLGIPARFGISVVEIERSGVLISPPGPENRLYPGDRVLLLGKNAGIALARDFLESKNAAGTQESDREAGRATLQTCVVENSPHCGKTFAELRITQRTGVRVAGIQRGATRIGNPSATDTLQNGDGLLLVGGAAQIAAFLRWFQADSGDNATA
ncbi:MAG: cation:proton antiporter [Puniceicoccales bacterium]|jgi:CPA2 family monovalent cation:H+ antiporter-2|nr:cation:proton antiporter [Puniceicoccales bacterium]